MDYNFKKIEKKWQDYWKENKTFNSDINSLKEPFYILNMFPYPSGDKLHMGHWYQYGIMDSWARFKKLQGKELFHPMGFDSFGLPAENYAIKNGVHPANSTMKNVKYMKKQFTEMGVSYDWNYSLMTSDPEYYKWTQWLFIQLYKQGLAYKKKAPVNWCSSCRTVLANEQVVDGCCERCDTEVFQKELSQWFFKITNFADKLLDNLDDLDWPAKTKAMQRNWIGRSFGTEIKFKTSLENDTINIFTTRPDTIFGATYLVIAPEHSFVKKLSADKNRTELNDYLSECIMKTELERVTSNNNKSGVFSGFYATNPVNEEKIPIWIADYVLNSYGTGAVMAVPAHDERDFQFAKKFNLPIKVVISENGDVNDTISTAKTEKGIVINSEVYNGLTSDEMIEKISIDLESKKIAVRKKEYRLRDWLVSRQRYWGAPIPIIYCERCGEVAVPENELPVELPSNVKFNNEGKSPLSENDEFKSCKCPSCKQNAIREVDTLDTFVCSSWYYLRYPETGNTNEAFNMDKLRKVLPAEIYCGGPEHACMHLLYSRFITHALHEKGLLDFEEPFPKLIHQGIILAPDGLRMSKSRGNSISPDSYVDSNGSDALRIYLLFGFNFVEGGPWNDSGFKATNRFLDKLKRLFYSNKELINFQTKNVDSSNESEYRLLHWFNSTIKRVTEDTERFMFNTSIARLMELNNEISKYQRSVTDINKELLSHVISTYLIILSPFIPHLAEEFWSYSGSKESISNMKWPQYKEEYLKKESTIIAVMVNGKVRAKIEIMSFFYKDMIIDIAQNHKNVSKYLEGNIIKNTIYIPEKIINFILK